MYTKRLQPWREFCSECQLQGVFQRVHTARAAVKPSSGPLSVWVAASVADLQLLGPGLPAWGTPGQTHTAWWRRTRHDKTNPQPSSSQQVKIHKKQSNIWTHTRTQNVCVWFPGPHNAATFLYCVNPWSTYSPDKPGSGSLLIAIRSIRAGLKWSCILITFP